MDEQLNELTLQEALSLMEQAVAEKGADFVYQEDTDARDGFGCVYFDGGAPSCIVGHVFAFKGAGPDDVLEYNSPSGQEHGGIAFVVDGFTYNNHTALVLRTAQIVQDDGKPWGVAVEAAKEYARELGYEVE